jgi:hypothetical protein
VPPSCVYETIKLAFFSLGNPVGSCMLQPGMCTTVRSQLQFSPYALPHAFCFWRVISSTTDVPYSLPRQTEEDRRSAAGKCLLFLRERERENMAGRERCCCCPPLALYTLLFWHAARIPCPKWTVLSFSNSFHASAGAGATGVLAASCCRCCAFVVLCHFFATVLLAAAAVQRKKKGGAAQ